MVLGFRIKTLEVTTPSKLANDILREIFYIFPNIFSDIKTLLCNLTPSCTNFAKETTLCSSKNWFKVVRGVGALLNADESNYSIVAAVVVVYQFTIFNVKVSLGELKLFCKARFTHS